MKRLEKTWWWYSILPSPDLCQVVTASRAPGVGPHVPACPHHMAGTWTIRLVSASRAPGIPVGIELSFFMVSTIQIYYLTCHI